MTKRPGQSEFQYTVLAIDVPGAPLSSGLWSPT